MGGLEAEQLGQTSPVGVILDDSKFDVGSKLLPELLIVLLLGNLLDHIQGFTDKLLTNDLKEKKIK